MKSYILLVTFLIIIFCRWSSASNTEMEEKKTSAIAEQIAKKLRSAWNWIWNREDSFAARCFGMARRLKFAIPMIIFKLGVIVTILAFLTIFSLKSLGLLLLLVMLNSTGVAKWAHSTHQISAKPQSVHFHVHPKDFVKTPYYTEIEHGGWHDKNEITDFELESLEDRLRKLKLYEEYYKKHIL